ncbi:MAG: GntR family transcriptional regulator [Christensenellales bacterium]|jgi:DNA-binding GntR family transcriptional regulator|nr:GntR family transcriptional regulator [Clostridium sp.]
MDLKKIAEEMQPRSMAARDWVFQVIRTAIVRGELPGDMPLRQDEISTALSVSHIPVREAFRQLEAQGLVRIYPNRGAVVTKLSCKELSDVMDTRILLEVGALRLALPHITEEDLARARELLELFSKEKDPIKGAELNLKLHFSLYDPCDNQTLLSLIDQMHANVDRYITPFFGKEEVSAELYTVDEHSQIISACESKDTELATAILRTHLQRTKNLLLKSPLLN